jgi:hypothetical protein
MEGKTHSSHNESASNDTQKEIVMSANEVNNLVVPPNSAIPTITPPQQNTTDSEASSVKKGEEDQKQLLEQFEALKTEKAALEQRLKAVLSDNEAHSAVEKQLSDRLAKLEKERGEELATARKKEISEIVNTAKMYQGLSEPEKEKQIEFWHASTHPVEQIKSILTPVERNFVQNLSANQQQAPTTQYKSSRLRLGGPSSAEQQKKCTCNDTVVTRKASTVEDQKRSSSHIPEYLQLAQRILGNGGFV